MSALDRQTKKKSACISSWYLSLFFLTTTLSYKNCCWWHWRSTRTSIPWFSFSISVLGYNIFLEGRYCQRNHSEYLMFKFWCVRIWKLYCIWFILIFFFKIFTYFFFTYQSTDPKKIRNCSLEDFCKNNGCNISPDQLWCAKTKFSFSYALCLLWHQIWFSYISSKVRTGVRSYIRTDISTDMLTNVRTDVSLT